MIIFQNRYFGDVIKDLRAATWTGIRRPRGKMSNAKKQIV